MHLVAASYQHLKAQTRLLSHKCVRGGRYHWAVVAAPYKHVIGVRIDADRPALGIPVAEEGVRQALRPCPGLCSSRTVARVDLHMALSPAAIRTSDGSYGLG